MGAPVSRARAEQVRRVIIDHYRGYTYTENGVLRDLDELPVLRAPHTGWGAHWVLCWEVNAPYEWTLLATAGGVAEFTGRRFGPAPLPREVFCEPINGVELGIYPP